MLDQNIINAGGAIGQIFGSALGAALGGHDQLTRLTSSVVGGTIGGLIGQKFGLVVATSMAADLSKVSLADVFASQNLDIGSAGIGAVSSFLTAELGNALQIPGFGGQLFNAATNGFTLSVLTQVKTSIGAGLTFEGAIAAIDWSAAVSGAIAATPLNVGNVLGTFLGQLLVPAKSHAGAIGGQLLGAIGSFLLPGVGSLIGSILGTVIGDLFGNTPHPAATDLLDQAGYLYAATHYQTSASDGGSYSVPDQMADPALAIINGYLSTVKGAALDHSKQVTIGYQTDPASYIVGVPSHPDAGLFFSTGYAVQAAAVDLLQHLEVIGGDLLLKRGHHNSSFYDPPPMPPADPSGDPGPTGAPIQPIASTQLAILSADLGVAKDYENYLNNREAINALMAANPDSAFTAGWIATFARVNELKLNQVGQSDFLGGLVGYLDSVNKAGLGAVAANASVSHGGFQNSVITVSIKVPNGAEVPGSLAAFADATSVSSDASGQTVQLQFNGNLGAGGFRQLGIGATGGDNANDLWFGGDGGQTFNGTGGHDILAGGAGNDTIRGGDGWDFVQGGAGNDTLFGDAGNDILRGGPGNDALDGGAGFDTAVYGAAFGSYTLVSWNGSIGVLTHGTDGSDRLQGIETIQFTDRTLAAGAVAAFDPWGYLASNTDVIQLFGVNLQAAFDHYVNSGFSEGRAATAFDPVEYLASNPGLMLEGVTLASATRHYVNNGYSEHRPTNSFDAAEYLASNPGLMLVGVTLASAALHYVNNGYSEHRLTNSFDAAEYLASNPGLMPVGVTLASAALHYVNNGYSEHRPTNSFDAAEYLASNPDLIQAGFTPASAAQQYVSAGYSQHRATTSFDVVEYLASNPDLIQAGVTPASAAQQYVSAGYSQHRATTSFDPLQYLASNPDLIPGGVTVASAAQHYVSTGYSEHRATTSFNAVEYLASNPELMLVGVTPASATQHYVGTGYSEHRATTSFDAAEYLASNTDLIQAGVTPATAAQHYVSTGYSEHRATTSFDTLEYLASNPDLILGGVTVATAAQHYVGSGYSEHRATNSFDPLQYLASNPDLIPGGVTPATAAQHFVSTGYSEHRAAHSFDPLEYLASNYDLIEAHFTPASALQHYVGTGYSEHRATTSFDALEYVASNKDLIHTIGLDTAAAEQQYVTAGYYQERALTSFDAPQYLANNPDLAALYGSNNFVAARQHYIAGGFDEGRTDRKPDQVIVHNADGSTTTTIYGAANTASWNSFRTDQDAQGHVTHQLGVNEGGGSWQNDYDVAASQSWITKISVTNGSNQLVSQVTNNDDGTHTLLANDPANAYAWSTFTMTFDAGWNFTSIGNVTNDDGSHTADMTKIWNSFDTLAWHPNPYTVSLAQPGSGASDGMPVVLDLDGNGIDIVPLGASTAAFDMDGQGGREHTAWVGNNDGLLAIDLGPDGKSAPDGVIDQTEEIVFTEWSPGASSDMAALRAVFDSDHDGLLDRGDARWSDFRVWQDANGDGVSQPGEVNTLDALGLASIGLEPTGAPQRFPDGSAIQGLASFMRADGTIGTAGDVALAYQNDPAHIFASIHNDWHIA